MAFTEFYCNASTGSNLNGGSSAGSPSGTDTAASYGRDTGAGGLDRIVASSGTPFSGCSVGEYVGVKATGGSAPADFVARVTAINASGASIDVNDALSIGTRPAHLASVDAKVGGVWKGPNDTSGFPLNIWTPLIWDGTDPSRLNLKNGTDYSISAGITVALGTNPYIGTTIQGYTTNPGDGGKFVLKGPATGTAFTLLTINGSSAAVYCLCDAEIHSNGNSGSAVSALFLNTSLTTSATGIHRVVVHDSWGNGIGVDSYSATLSECEVYNCNLSNTANCAGVRAHYAATMLRCFIHDNIGTNTDGYSQSYNSYQTLVEDCVFDSNGKNGLLLGSYGGHFIVRGSVFYNNGVSTSAAGILYVAVTYDSHFVCENNIFVKNSGYGIAASTQNSRYPSLIYNNAYGQGTMANGSGAFGTFRAFGIQDSIALPSNMDPFVNASGGDFRTTQAALAYLKNAGRGLYQQTDSGYTDPSTIMYPDAGLQHQDTGGEVANPVIKAGVI